MPLVSIIVPIYNVAKYIEKCTRSLFEQTFDDIEYIFVNDCTPDDSMDILLQIINEYPDKRDKCKIINHDKNKGLTFARNSGLSVASGKYIIHCDSDDWMEKDMISSMYELAEAENADIVTCDFRMIYQDSTVDSYSIDWGKNKILSLQKYIANTWTVLWNLLVKRDIYLKYNIRSLAVAANFCEDFNLSVKLLLHANKVVHLKKVLYNYNRLNLSSILHNNKKIMHDEQIMYLDVLRYMKKMGEYQYYEKQICWRILRSKQEWVLNKSTYKDFLNLYPESHKYILSCPFLNIKLKIMMWCLVHHISFISQLMLFIRYLKHKVIF
jgi:glycosyltransferase involved in cell wall biosynthesis